MLRWISLPLLSLLLLAGGCASDHDPVTVQYRQPPQNETVYQARSINLGTLFESGGLGQDPRVVMRSWATCPGENCKPKEAWISFSMQRAAKEMQLVSDRSVEIRTATDMYTWKQKNVTGSPAPTQGDIARVSLSISTLEDLATTKRFHGKIGNEEFSLSCKDRAPLRALLKKARHPSQDQTL